VAASPRRHAWHDGLIWPHHSNRRGQKMLVLKKKQTTLDLKIVLKKVKNKKKLLLSTNFQMLL
jgi:hypothetical protein